MAIWRAEQEKHCSTLVSDVALMHLLLTLNRFHTLFWRVTIVDFEQVNSDWFVFFLEFGRFNC